MDKVVYILGAGFSAPLGIPVVSNFLEKSKDLYAGNSLKYKHFKDVFDTIKELRQDYYESDMFNIEEILSILEMNEQLKEKRRSFNDYIIDVVKAFTPEVQPKEQFPGNFTEHLFGPPNERNGQFGNFVGSLLNLNFNKSDGDIWCNKSRYKKAIYSVITLNYDLVLENYSSYIGESFQCHEGLGFCQTIASGQSLSPNTTYLAKLHGCVETGQIIPPTWNKSLNPHIKATWQMAHQLLAEANHIRIIGYSLPVADSYIKYLLKSAVTLSQNLKRIDILCLDPDGSAQRRYDEFVKYPRKRFINGNVLDYLAKNINRVSSHNKTPTVGVDLVYLEEAHEFFFS